VVVGLSLVVNRTLSTLLPFRVRPMHSIGANAPLGDWHPNFMQWSSFPSDNATYLFAIAAGLWIISRWLGLFFGVYADCRTMPNGLVFPEIHRERSVICSA
jgi:undecaprenyl-diphosphatase